MSLLEFRLNPILFFFFSTDFYTKSEGECLRRGLGGFYWIKGLARNKEAAHGDLLSVLKEDGFSPALVELHTDKSGLANHAFRAARADVKTGG